MLKIKNIINGFILLIVTLSILYIFINLTHLCWTIVNPEGFWSFLYFVSILSTALFLIAILIGVLLIILFGIINLLSDFPKNLTLSNILKSIGILFLILITIGFNFISTTAIDMFITKKISDRYSYIERSDKLINEGKYKESLEYSKKAYLKYKNIDSPSKFFLLSYYFFKTKYGEQDIITKKYATTINYAYCLENNNIKLKDAEKLYKDALVIAENKVLNNDSSFKIFPYQSLANLNLNLGNYSEAQNYFNKLLEINTISNENDLELLCLSQETFASYYEQVGDIVKAKKLRENNVKLWELKSDRLNSIQYLTLLIDAAESEIINGNYKKAATYLLKANPLAEKRKKKSIYLKYLFIKGNYCSHYSKNDYGNVNLIKKGWYDKFITLISGEKNQKDRFKKEAILCFEKIVEFEKKENGENSIGYILSIHRLVLFYWENGDKINAMNYLNKIGNKIKKLETTNFQVYNSILLLNSIIDNELKGFNAVKSNLKKIEAIHLNRLVSSYPFLTEKEKETYKLLIENSMNSINSIYIKANTIESNQNLYNNILAIKEIALNSNEYTRDFISNLEDNHKIEYFNIIKKRDSLELIKKNNNENNLKNILIEEKNFLRKIMNSNGYRQFNPKEITWQLLRDTLNKNEIAIEFIKDYNSKIYYALIIKKDIIFPKLIPLFLENNILSILDEKGKTELKINTIYETKRDSLYNLIWKSLEPEMVQIQKVYISLDGILHNLPIQTLLKDKDITLLSSTRKIISYKKRKNNKPIYAKLIGGINYGNISNKNNSRDINIYINLPHTINEINNINKILRAKYPKDNINMILNDDANEIAFKKLKFETPHILHIATHGYYIPQDKNIVSSKISELYTITQSNPMLRSGLVLAGVNENNFNTTDNDGILTSQEIARMDLSNVDLVVLSACETGLGDLAGNEGVFGLQRAFKLAGVKSIMMSLWKVPDEETAELMGYFYKNLINNMSKENALKNAQKEMKKKGKSIFSWGGFVILEN